jgi:hypothetical protein
MVVDRYELIINARTEMVEVLRFSSEAQPGMEADRVAFCSKDDVIKFILNKSPIN